MPPQDFPDPVNIFSEERRQILNLAFHARTLFKIPYPPTRTDSGFSISPLRTIDILIRVPSWKGEIIGRQGRQPGSGNFCLRIKKAILVRGWERDEPGGRERQLHLGQAGKRFPDELRLIFVPPTERGYYLTTQVRRNRMTSGRFPFSWQQSN